MVLAAGSLLLAVSYAVEPFRNFQLATVAAYLCATAGLTVLTGLNGQLSLGHGALMATGAYTVALCQNAFADAGVDRRLAAAAVAAVAALVSHASRSARSSALAAARLRGPYLAGVTLAVAVVVPALATTFDGVFNGEQGLSVPRRAAAAALGPYFPLRAVAGLDRAGAAAAAHVAAAGQPGPQPVRPDLRAVRDDEVAARLAGIHVARTQVLAFVVSAASAGLGGALLAVLAQSVSPGAFSLTLSLFLLMAVVIGGLGSLAGAVWGAVLLVALPDLTHSVDRAAHALARGGAAAGGQPPAGDLRPHPDRRHDRRARRHAGRCRVSAGRWPAADRRS